MFTRTFSRWLISLLVAAASLVINVLLTRPAAQAKHAATLINCAGSIQACIDAASGGDTIVIPAGTYTESLTLSKPVSLTGVNSTTTIIHAVAGQRVLTVTGAAITNSVVISGLTFTGGSAVSGGGLYAYGPLQIVNSNFISNTASADGGGAYTFGATIIDNSRFENNYSYFDGGGLFAQEDTPLIISHSVFISNSSRVAGGGIRAYGPLTLTYSQLIQNRSIQNAGGGLDAVDLTFIENTDFLSNTAFGPGGGIIAFMTTTIHGGRFESNRCTSWGCFGGAVDAISGLNITDAQFISNSATYWGGGIYNEQLGDSRIVNTLFAHNTVNKDGAAIFIKAPGQHDLLHVTIADNMLNAQSAISITTGTLRLTNTIIASHAIGINNSGGKVYADYNLFFGNITDTLGSITSGGHSLIGNPLFVDPFHDDYRLHFGSAAIDRGVDADVYTDLDGNPRPVNRGFDIGAYEYQGPIVYLFLPIVRK